MIQQMLNRMCTENHALKRKLGNTQVTLFFVCICFAGYISIHKHTILPLILFIVVYVAVKLKGKYHEKT